MKQLLFVGTTRKSVFTVPLIHVLQQLGKSVLLVDLTAKQEYNVGYFDGHFDESFNEVSTSIDCVSAETYPAAAEILLKNNHKPTDYDFVLIDANQLGAIEGLPLSSDPYYVSDEDNINIQYDVVLLHYLLDRLEEPYLNRIHFESAYGLGKGYLSQQMKDRVEWLGFDTEIEHDVLLTKLDLQSQHDESVKITKYAKAFRETIFQLLIKEMPEPPYKQLGQVLKLSTRSYKRLEEESIKIANERSNLNGI